jgi:tetratricopeptide (TPR) repeat protein
MSADELTTKAKSLRELKNYAEAVLVAREATRVDPEDADAWWQLALATDAYQGLGKALEAFKKTTELAPRFGPGWQMLGMAEADVGLIEEAKASLRTAYECDASLTIALDRLADLSQQTNDERQEFWALEHVAAVNNLSGYQCNRLGILHHNKGEYAQAIQFYRRCANELDDAAGWINLGLVLSERAVSQDADAVDALRLGQSKYPQHERFQKLLDGLLPRTSDLALHIRNRDALVLGSDEHYQSYLNPIELLDLGGEDLGKLDAKKIQRAKRRLLQEIELEDGRVSWMGGMKLDRSRALALCDKIISDEQMLQNHVLVYRDPRLNGFLSRGELEHFLVSPDDGDRDVQIAFQ